MWFFGRALRRSKTIRVLHLSGNPGITTELIDFLASRTHSIRRQEINFIDFNELPSNKELVTTDHTYDATVDDDTTSHHSQFSALPPPKEKKPVVIDS